MAKHLKRGDRICVADAIALLRRANGFVLIADVPDSNHERAEAAVRRGDPVKTKVKVYASPEFQPPPKTMRILAEVLHGMWEIHGKSNGKAPPAHIEGQVTTGANGKVTLGPWELRHMSFATDDGYGEQINLLAVIEIVPPGKQPGEGETKVLHNCVSDVTVDEAQADFARLETWAAKQVGVMAGKTNWGVRECKEMIDLSLIQLRKAWEQEAAEPGVEPDAPKDDQ